MHLINYLEKFHINIDFNEFMSIYTNLTDYVERVNYIRSKIYEAKSSIASSLIYKHNTEEMSNILQISYKRGSNKSFQLFNGHLINLDTLQIVCSPLRKMININNNTNLSSDNKLASIKISSNYYYLIPAIDGTTIYLSHYESDNNSNIRGLIDNKWLISTVRTINAGILSFTSDKAMGVLVNELFHKYRINTNLLDVNFTYTFIVQDAEWNPAYTGESCIHYICKAKNNSDTIIYDYTYDKIFKPLIKPLKTIDIIRKTDNGQTNNHTLKSLLTYCNSRDINHFGIYVISKSPEFNQKDYHINTKRAEILKTWIYTPMFVFKSNKQLAINMYITNTNSDDLVSIGQIIPLYQEYLDKIHDIYIAVKNFIINGKISDDADINELSQKIKNEIPKDIVGNTLLMTLRSSQPLFQLFCGLVMNKL